MTPTSLVPKALEIIENVQKLSGDVWVNKNQCKRVADRFRAIGAGLNVDFSAASNGSNSMSDYPAFEELLTVLRKGQALVSENVQWAGIKGVLTRTDNREAFEEIHEELDNMKATFPFEGFSGDFETSLGIHRTAKLTKDAENDSEEMKHLIQSSPATENLPEALDLKKVEKVVLEKIVESDGDLPSFLKIDPSTIDIKDPVRKQEFLSKQKVETYGWAIVCAGSWLGCDYAVKVFRSDKSQWNKDQVLKEARALMELRHPHIIRFIGFAQGANLCYLLMEMMPEKDLRHFMKQRASGRRPFTRSQELDIITQIAKGMLYLHTQGYVHGDLKCSNILVKKHGPDYIDVKVGDLRYSQKLESVGGLSETDKANTVRRPRWSPLEALDNYGGEKPTDDLLKQADVYSFAMTCYEVVTGNWPFQDVRGAALTQLIKAGERPKLPDDLQQSGLKGLIESCWHEDPSQRPPFENICVLLAHIRSMPADTNKSSNVWSVYKQITLVGGTLSGWYRGVHESARAVDQTNPTTTWGGNPDRERGEDDGAASAKELKIPACLKIEPKTLKKVRRIGRGSFAKVYEATWLGCRFAVKRMKKFENAASVSDLQKELDFLIQLRHPYIIQMVGLSIDKKGRCSIVMEYMNGSLRDLIDSRINRRSLFEFHEVVGIITKLAQGMLFLHSRGVIHRDLKAPNVLCQEHAGSIDVKIVDFGVSQVIADAQSGVTTVGVGTGYWRAPEIFPTKANRSRECDVNLLAADVYSFAMTCYEILTGWTPFQVEFGDSRSKYDEVVNGLRPKLPLDLHYTGLKELITDCWQTDPLKRPDFAQICTRLNAISPHC